MEENKTLPASEDQPSAAPADANTVETQPVEGAKAPEQEQTTQEHSGAEPEPQKGEDKKPERDETVDRTVEALRERAKAAKAREELPNGSSRRLSESLDTSPSASGPPSVCSI